MSIELISRSSDLQKLQNEGYEVEVNSGYLILHSIPYVNSTCEIALGALVTDLTLNNNQSQRPRDHQVWFTGEQPCNKDGSIISAIGARQVNQTLCEGLKALLRFSCKPRDGYPDYYAKMTRYVEIISNPARAIDPKATARTYKPIRAGTQDSVFRYIDSSSTRAGISELTRMKFKGRIAIVGLGGTGSYIIDLVAKTHVQEIHLFDGDEFLQHNAFRAPGAASIETLSKKPFKVDYYADIYSRMRHGIFPHVEYMNEETVIHLADYDFVFLCVDNGAVRKCVSGFLLSHNIPFVDAGMNVELIEEAQCLRGACRVTLCTPNKSDHFFQNVSSVNNDVGGLYETNIQVADLNALNAAMAVVKWKKYCGFYQDLCQEHQSTYAINAHALTRDAIVKACPV